MLKGWARLGLNDEPLIKKGMECFDAIHEFLRKQDSDLRHNSPQPEAPALREPTFTEAFRFWVKLEFISIGDPLVRVVLGG